MLKKGGLRKLTEGFPEKTRSSQKVGSHMLKKEELRKNVKGRLFLTFGSFVADMGRKDSGRSAE